MVSYSVEEVPLGKLAKFDRKQILRNENFFDYKGGPLYLVFPVIDTVLSVALDRTKR